MGRKLPPLAVTPTNTACRRHRAALGNDSPTKSASMVSTRRETTGTNRASKRPADEEGTVGLQSQKRKKGGKKQQSPPVQLVVTADNPSSTHSELGESVSMHSVEANNYTRTRLPNSIDLSVLLQQDMVTIYRFLKTKILPRIKFVPTKNLNLAYSDEQQSLCYQVMKGCNALRRPDASVWWISAAHYTTYVVNRVRTDKCQVIKKTFKGKSGGVVGACLKLYLDANTLVQIGY